MTYLDFFEIINPAIEIGKEEIIEYKDLFDEELFSFNTATEEDLNQLENFIQLKVPHFYRAFLMNFNPKGYEMMFNEILGIYEIKNIFENVNSRIFKDGFLPIIQTNSGGLYCIKNDDEMLYHADHELDYEIKEFVPIKDYFINLVNQKLGL